ncbi:hypothetical protein [Effusibacillus consociatus]|uniref:Outer membrane lipoprotein-sorting protein n=1 Tax=Effusibacillus consociatus TaxID=1117041 RepID=A0ABV9Q4R8_9BACL
MRNIRVPFRLKQKLLRTAVLTLSLALLLGGCGPLITAPDSRDIPIEKKEKKLDENGWRTILEAVRVSKSITNFSVQADLRTREQNKYHESRVFGHVVLPDKIVMSQSVDGRSYYVYQDENITYYRKEDVWRPVERIRLPDTWGSLERLSNAQLSKVYRQKDISMLTPNDTEVYEFEADAVAVAGLPAPQGKSIPSRYTIYIDKKDRFIRQIDIVSTSAVDDVGTLFSEAAIKFFDIGTTKVEMPAALEKHLKEQKR